MKPCRECTQTVSEQAATCPGCGAPFPAQAEWDGYGFEYRSEGTIFGMPLVHVAFKYRANRRPVPARGFIAIGQFAFGVITVSQFGIGVISIGQFVIAGWALAQIALAYSLVAQVGVYLAEGRGQAVWSVKELMEMLF